MFCVECGAEGPTFEGLCAACFAKRRPVVDPPAYLDLPRCPRCGSFRFASGWTRADLDAAVLQTLRDQVPVKSPFRRVSFTHVARAEDEANLSLTVKATGRHEGLEVVQAFHTRLRIKPTVCETCQRQEGRYFEGILQVRGDGRDLTPDELRGVRTMVFARVDRGRADAGDFVSRIEDVHGGLDFYVSSNGLGARLAREVADAYGGTVAASPKLYGQRKGKELYRVTSLVRLPAFRAGEVVRRKASLAEVLEVRPFVRLRDLESGEARRYKPKDLRGLRRVDAERFDTALEAGPNGDVVATHPESGAQRPVRTKGVRPGGRAIVVWTDEAAYLSGFATSPSKD